MMVEIDSIGVLDIKAVLAYRVRLVWEGQACAIVIIRKDIALISREIAFWIIEGINGFLFAVLPGELKRIVHIRHNVFFFPLIK